MITFSQKESAAGSRQLTRPVFLPYARRHNRLILDQSWTESVRSQATYKHCGEHSRIEECVKGVAIRARPIKPAPIRWPTAWEPESFFLVKIRSPR
jgi:hypothetical protein